MARELRDVLGGGTGAHEFVVSMPAHYADTFDHKEIAEHAAIVARRGNLVTHVELWKTLPNGSVAICVVADDQPGLLSMISAALVSRRLDVTRAQIYCRKAERALEAVDFFWLQKTTKLGVLRAISASEIVGVGEALNDIAKNRTALALGANESASRFDPIPTSRVFFDAKALQHGKYVLVVEAKDRPGLLLSVTLALSREDVTILESDVRTAEHLVRDRFTLVARDQQPISSTRMQAIKRNVLAATRGDAQESEIARARPGRAR